MTQPTLFIDYGPVEHASATVHHRPEGWYLSVAIRRERCLRWDDRLVYEGLTTDELADVLAAVLRS